MRHKRLKLSAIFLLGFGLTGLQAQENVNASGGNASGSGGSISYSVGQITYQTHSGANYSVSEGVQQPYEISVAIGINEVKEINLSVWVYPNPATSNVTLEIKDAGFSALSFQFYDLQGRLLKSEKITDKLTNIDMDYLVQSTYFVKILQGNNEVKTFTIIKK